MGVSFEKTAAEPHSGPLPWTVPDHVYVIAEIGINHNGNIDLALALIDEAKDAGCDAVKFQKRDPDVCVPRDQQLTLRETPWGTMTYLDYKKRIEFGEVEYDQIDAHCQKLSIAWSASAWDVPSQRFLRRYPRTFNKVASAMLTDNELLHEVASEGIKTYISTGMSTLAEIDAAVSIFIEHHTPFELMHSVSVYPAQSAELNLATILTLRDRYGVPVGYSGHESSVSPSIVAVTLGAASLERHITLDRSMWGTDHASSLEPAGLRQLTGAIRKVREELGDGTKRVLEAETTNAKKLRRPS